MAYLVNLNSGKEMWEALLKAFDTVTFAESSVLYDKVWAPIKEGRNVIDHMLHLRGLKNQSKMMDSSFDDTVFMAALYSQLPKEYDICKKMLNEEKGEANFDTLCTLVTRAYYLLENRGKKQEKLDSVPPTKPFCTNCKKRNHTVQDCWFLQAVKPH